MARNEQDTAKRRRAVRVGEDGAADARYKKAKEPRARQPAKKESA